VGRIFEIRTRPSEENDEKKRGNKMAAGNIDLNVVVRGQQQLDSA
jgi:hypothetical protein